MKTVLMTLGKKTYSIGTGWLNLAKSHLGLSDTEVETLAVKRLSLCLQCEHNHNNICRGGCGCVLTAKVRSINESCPKNIW